MVNSPISGKGYRFSDFFLPGRIGAGSSPATVLTNDKLLSEAGINDKARKVKLRGKQVIVPLKFDEDGNPAAIDKLIFKRLSLNDLRFLQLWRKADWNTEKAIQDSNLPRLVAERLIKKLICFREEDAKVRALAEIPTPDWIATKHVENVYEGGTLSDSQQKSLAELAKIEGAYKNNLNVNVTQNVFNLPKYDPTTEAKLKRIADEEAMLIQDAQLISNG